MNNISDKFSNNPMLKNIGAFLLISAIFVVGIYIGRMNPDPKELDAKGYSITGDLKSEFENVDVNILWEVWQKLEDEHISSEIDPKNLIYGAVKGMVNSLDDPYTAFLEPSEVSDYKDSNAGEYQGIGATLKQEGSYVGVESPVDKSPAQKAGVKAGDLILKVDDKDMYNKTLYEAVSLIRGEAGTNVKIEIFRPADQKEYTFNITREKIDIDNIELEDLGNGYLKIKLYKFTESDIQEFIKMWDSVVSQALAKNPKGIIIDLRNNPGGYVSGVEYVLGDFIPAGKIALIEETKNGVRTEHLIQRNGRLLNVPIVVMVNSGSASASEIFAGAIQDYGRGKIIGQKTVGKGVEQKLVTLSDGSLLQVVFQKWLTPMGKNISKEDPITPDLIVEDENLNDQKAIEILLGSN